MDSSPQMLIYEMKTTSEDGNVFETCENVFSENNLGIGRKKLIFLGDSRTGKTETFRTLLGRIENQSKDDDVNVLYTSTTDVNTGSNVEEYIPLWKISQYDGNGNFSTIRLSVKQSLGLSSMSIRLSEDFQDFLHLLLLILAVGIQSSLDVSSLLVLIFVLHQQYRYHRLIDTVYPMGLIFSLEGIDALGLIDSTDKTLSEALCYVPCLIIVVALLMFLIGVEQQNGGSLGYTLGLCLIVFPMNGSQTQHDKYVPARLINTLACCVLALVKTKMKNKNLLQFSGLLTLMQLTAVPVALILNQCTSVFSLGLPIIIITDLVSRISYVSGWNFSSYYSSGNRERKPPNFAVFSVFYFNYGYFFILDTNKDAWWYLITTESLIFLSVGVLFAIHILYFYGKEGGTNIYEKCNYPTMPASEFLGQRLGLWDLEHDFPSDPLPNDAVCLLFFNAAAAVKDPIYQKKSLNQWLNKIASQSRRRNIPVFYIGTHSGSVRRKDLEKFAISISSTLDLRFSNMIMTNKDGLPVFYVENTEENNQGLEILKRRILKETK